MDIKITVEATGRYWSGGVHIRVPDPMVMSFNPLKTTEDPVCAAITGDALSYSQDVENVLKIRNDAAEYIGKAVAEHLLCQMKKNDTHNGYRLIDDPNT